MSEAPPGSQNPPPNMPNRRELVRLVELHTRQRITNSRKSIRLANPYRIGEEIKVTAGEMLDSRLSSEPDEPVWGIFETGHLYMIVTPSHGGVHGSPYLFRKAEILGAE